MSSDPGSLMTFPRERKLNPKGQEQYELKTEQYLDKLRRLKRDIDSYLFNIDVHHLSDQEQVEQIRQDIIDRFDAFQQESSRFICFLQGTRTKESSQEESGHRLIAQSLRTKVDIFITSIDEHLHIPTASKTERTKSVRSNPQLAAATKLEKRDSVKSSPTVKMERKGSVKFNRVSKKSDLDIHSTKTRQSSLESFTSHASVMLVKEQVKLEAAKVRLRYTEQEQELTRQKAALYANFERLEREREVDEAESKVRTIQEALQGSGGDSSTEHSDITEDFVFHRTEQFVTQDSYERFNGKNQMLDTDSKHNDVKFIQTVADVHATQDDCNNNKVTNTIQDIKPDQVINVVKSDRRMNTGPDQTKRSVQNVNYDQFIDTVQETKHDKTLSADAPIFIPSTNEVNMFDEFSRFMVRKELVFSRLTKYDDQPDMYIAWKSMFKNIVHEIRLTAAEEVDLLVKWLGPTSSKQALRIRSANADNPEKCRNRIWERLENRFGRPEMVEDAIKRKIASFPKMTTKDYRPLFDLSDIVEEINSIMDSVRYHLVFAHFNSSSGVNQIVSKLPYNLQEKWTQEANRYKTRNNIMYPPFSVFSHFIADMAKLRNDPSFHYELSTESNSQQRPRRTGPVHVSARITESKDLHNGQHGQRINSLSRPIHDNHPVESSHCPIHGTNHTLNMCHAFRIKPISERKDFLKKNGLCYRCCGPKQHLSKSCTETVKCIVCKSFRHPSALHVDIPKSQDSLDTCTSNSHGGENTVNNSCTQVCGTHNGTSKSCAKIILVNVFPKDNPIHVRQVYCLIDDQSNRSLATAKFFDEFEENGKDSEYVLSTCSGQFTTSGRRARNYIIESFNHENQLLLPEIIECQEIPNNRHEIPSQELARKFDHLKDIAQFIQPIQPEVSIELLIGRDLISSHHVLDHRIGNDGLPYAQKLPLGWVILGETCLGKVHYPDVVHANKTHVLEDGRATFFKPCEYDLQLKSDVIFTKTPYDENIGLSVEDKDFLNVMDANFERDQNGQWTVPLPFHVNRQPLRSNRSLALKRAKSFDYSLSKNERKAKHVTDFMQRMIDNNHAEEAPSLKSGEHWYLPIFGVYHPRKPDNVRLVFDSSAKFENQSLNDVLLKGPDLTNKLLGILLNFRKEKIAITCDVEQMFYNFKVREDHRDFLRFLWHQQNDLSKPLTDFRMNVHVFGNRPSPAIATYGFRKTVENEDEDVREFVNEHFYVDDGLISCQDVNEAVSLIKRTQSALWDGGKMRLHKITSNSTELLEQFDSSDLAKVLKDLDLSSDELPTQRSLGVSWDISTDEITFQISPDVKPFTRRGALSTINSIYDPVGFAAPVIIRGKLLLREMIGSSVVNWDDILSDSYLDQWEAWVTSLKGLETLRISRMYTTVSFATATLRQIHIFSDASKEAIGAVAYLKLSNEKSTEISFVMGKAKVAPSTGHTIPRLELCGAVLAVEIADIIKEHLKIETENMYFYTDSQVVLGYINNTSRRFYVYVCNRISRIRASSNPGQWHYVSSEMNPADIATRSVHAATLQNTTWFRGPSFLLQDIDITSKTDHDLVHPDWDQEVRPAIQTLKTTSVESKPFASVSSRFDRYSVWRKLISAINCLRSRIKHHKSVKTLMYNVVEQLLETERFIVKKVQEEAFQEEIDSLIECDKRLPRNSSLLPINPFLDSNGLLRVGGRIKHSELSDSCKQPIIIPKGHHIAILLICHYHAKVAHQGRSFTEAAIRNAGYWIVGVKRLINSVIRKCVHCKKLRGKVCTQQMADLPKDRVTPSPPFSYIGVDVFGPWPVTFRRTRGGVAQSKRWALLFACLVTRGIHLEVIEELSSSSFINAWRRFIALRGPVRQVRSDRGTNFVGATQDLSMIAQFVEDRNVQNFLNDNRITWQFNPPHASHFGGAWERLIGMSRRILDSLLLENRFKDLTHEMLTTFLAEVTAIVNNRPLTSVSYDSESPSVITPSLLLTQKTANDISPFPDFEKKDYIRHHWKYVQFLAQQFWAKWQHEYLHSLQVRPKWQMEEPNVKVGTVVLMKDNNCARNYWPTGIVQRVFPSEDGKVRKVELRMIRDGQPVTYVRPISQIVLLVEPD